MRVIKRNVIRCRKCGDIIESKTVHDFRQCSCGACFVDGGTEYCRIGGNMDDIDVLTEYEEVPSYIIEVKTHYGGFYCSEIEQSKVNRMIEYYEDQWDYVRITDGDKVIYETKGFDN